MLARIWERGTVIHSVGSANWYSHYGNQCGYSSKIWKSIYLKIQKYHCWSHIQKTIHFTMGILAHLFYNCWKLETTQMSINWWTYSPAAPPSTTILFLFRKGKVPDRYQPTLSYEVAVRLGASSIEAKWGSPVRGKDTKARSRVKDSPCSRS